MITRDNLNDVIKQIDNKTKNRILNSCKEYCVLELHCFNAGSYTSVKLTNNFDRYKNVCDHGNCILEIDEIKNILEDQRN